MWEFSLEQRGMVVASGSGPKDDVIREGQHYAMMYSQDGPCVLHIREACTMCDGMGFVGEDDDGADDCPNCKAPAVSSEGQ